MDSKSVQEVLKMAEHLCEELEKRIAEREAGKTDERPITERIESKDERPEIP